MSCSTGSNFYKSILSKCYGIGKNPLTNKDILFSYLDLNKQYTKSSCDDDVNNNGSNGDTSSNSSTTKLVGIMIPINPDPTVNNAGNKPLEFFINDQAAYLGGYVKNDEYLLSKNNRYGLPEGMKKVITEEFGEE